ncbi:hypothetical protein [Streptomyces xantholiticus]|uniref:hypothetical protein n=1 Tax=Streptomyces xantholiticus TaxID=68285 RepID=UPI0016768A6C|nr:hypothetical protein [Streptomyces xantholiticus]GGW30808.1 hypothetical protein GCM10010381_14120 [Streptomyces xantholiticus]
MAIQSTPQLDALLFVLIGEKLLQANEDMAYESRLAYARMARRLRDLSDVMEQSGLNSARALPPAVGQNYLRAIRLFYDDGGTNHLKSFADQLDEIAEGRAVTSSNIIESKWQIIAELIRLLIELMVTAILAAFSGGTSAGGTAVAQARSRVLILTILDALFMHTGPLMGILTGAIGEAFDALMVRLAMMSFGPDGRRPQGVDWAAIGKDAFFGGLNGLFVGALAGAGSLIGDTLKSVFKGNNVFGNGNFGNNGNIFRNMPGTGAGGDVAKGIGAKAEQPSLLSRAGDALAGDAKTFAVGGLSEASSEVIVNGLLDGKWQWSWETFAGAGISSVVGSHLHADAVKVGESFRDQGGFGAGLPAPQASGGDGDGVRGISNTGEGPLSGTGGVAGGGGPGAGGSRGINTVSTNPAVTDAPTAESNGFTVPALDNRGDIAPNAGAGGPNGRPFDTTAAATGNGPSASVPTQSRDTGSHSPATGNTSDLEEQMSGDDAEGAASIGALPPGAALMQSGPGSPFGADPHQAPSSGADGVTAPPSSPAQTPGAQDNSNLAPAGDTGNRNAVTGNDINTPVAAEDSPHATHAPLGDLDLVAADTVGVLPTPDTTPVTATAGQGSEDNGARDTDQDPFAPPISLGLTSAPPTVSTTVTGASPSPGTPGTTTPDAQSPQAGRTSTADTAATHPKPADAAPPNPGARDTSEPSSAPDNDLDTSLSAPIATSSNTEPAWSGGPARHDAEVPPETHNLTPKQHGDIGHPPAGPESSSATSTPAGTKQVDTPVGRSSPTPDRPQDPPWDPDAAHTVGTPPPNFAQLRNEVNLRLQNRGDTRVAPIEQVANAYEQLPPDLRDAHLRRMAEGIADVLQTGEVVRRRGGSPTPRLESVAETEASTGEQASTAGPSGTSQDKGKARATDPQQVPQVPVDMSLASQVDSFVSDPGEFVSHSLLSVDFLDGITARLPSLPRQQAYHFVNNLMPHFDRHWFTLVVDPRRQGGNQGRNAFYLTPALEKYAEYAGAHRERMPEANQFFDSLQQVLPPVGGARYIGAGYIQYKPGRPKDAQRDVGHSVVHVNKDAEAAFNPDFVFTDTMNGCAFAVTDVTDETFTAWHFQSPTTNSEAASRFRRHRHPTDWFGDDEYMTRAPEGLSEGVNFLWRNPIGDWQFMSQENVVSHDSMAKVLGTKYVSRPLLLTPGSEAAKITEIYHRMVEFYLGKLTSDLGNIKSRGDWAGEHAAWQAFKDLLASHMKNEVAQLAEIALSDQHGNRQTETFQALAALAQKFKNDRRGLTDTARHFVIIAEKNGYKEANTSRSFLAPGNKKRLVDEVTSRVRAGQEVLRLVDDAWYAWIQDLQDEAASWIPTPTAGPSAVLPPVPQPGGSRDAWRDPREEGWELGHDITVMQERFGLAEPETPIANRKGKQAAETFQEFSRAYPYSSGFYAYQVGSAGTVILPDGVTLHGTWTRFGDDFLHEYGYILRGDNGWIGRIVNWEELRTIPRTVETDYHLSTDPTHMLFVPADGANAVRLALTGTDPYTGRQRNNGADWVRAHEPALPEITGRLFGPDPQAAHRGQANPVNLIQAENDLYEGYQAFWDQVEGTHQPQPHTPAPLTTAPAQGTTTPAANPGQPSPPPGPGAVCADHSAPPPPLWAPAEVTQGTGAAPSPETGDVVAPGTESQLEPEYGLVLSGDPRRMSGPRSETEPHGAISVPDTQRRVRNATDMRDAPQSAPTDDVSDGSSVTPADPDPAGTEGDFDPKRDFMTAEGEYQTLSDYFREGEWWKLFLDPRDHERARRHHPDDPGRMYDVDKSPGFRQGMVEAYRLFLDNPDGVAHRMDASSYLALHKTVAAHLGKVPEWSDGKTRFPLRSSALSDDILQERLAGRRLVLKPDPESLRAPDAKTAITVLLYATTGAELLTNYKLGGAPHLVDAAFDQYYEEVGKAAIAWDRLSAIGRVVRTLQVIHPFEDANRRVNVHLLLQKFLLEQGFRPVVTPLLASLFQGGYSVSQMAGALAWTLGLRRPLPRPPVAVERGTGRGFAEATRPLREHIRAASRSQVADVELAVVANPDGRVDVAVLVPGASEPVTMGPAAEVTHALVVYESESVLQCHVRVLGVYRVRAAQLAAAYAYAEQSFESSGDLVGSDGLGFAGRFVAKALGLEWANRGADARQAVEGVTREWNWDWADGVAPHVALTPEDHEAVDRARQWVARDPMAARVHLAWARYRVAFDHQRPLILGAPSAAELERWSLLSHFSFLVGKVAFESGENAAAELSHELGIRYRTLRVPRPTGATAPPVDGGVEDSGRAGEAPDMNPGAEGGAWQGLGSIGQSELEGLVRRELERLAGAARSARVVGDPEFAMRLREAFDGLGPVWHSQPLPRRAGLVANFLLTDDYFPLKGGAPHRDQDGSRQAEQAAGSSRPSGEEALTQERYPGPTTSQQGTEPRNNLADTVRPTSTVPDTVAAQERAPDPAPARRTEPAEGPGTVNQQAALRDREAIENARLLNAALDRHRPPRLDETMQPPGPLPGPVVFDDGSRLPEWLTHPTDTNYGNGSATLRGIDEVVAHITETANVPQGKGKKRTDPAAALKRALLHTPRQFTGDGWESPPFLDAAGTIRALHVVTRPHHNWERFSEPASPVKLDDAQRSQITTGRARSLGTTRQFAPSVGVGPAMGVFAGFGRLGLGIGRTHGYDFNTVNQNVSQAETRTTGGTHLHLTDVQYDVTVRTYTKPHRAWYHRFGLGRRSDGKQVKSSPDDFTFGVHNGLVVRLSDGVTTELGDTIAPRGLRLGPESDYRMVRTEGVLSVAQLRDDALRTGGAKEGSSAHQEITRFFTSEHFQQIAERLSHGPVPGPLLVSDDAARTPLGAFAVERAVPVRGRLLSETEAAEMRSTLQQTVKNERTRTLADSQEIYGVVGPSFTPEDVGLPVGWRIMVGFFGRIGRVTVHAAGFGGSAALKTVGRVKDVPTDLYAVEKKVVVRWIGSNVAKEYTIRTLDRMTRAEARRLAGWDDGSQLRGEAAAVPQPPAYLSEDDPGMLGPSRVEAFSWGNGAQAQPAAERTTGASTGTGSVPTGRTLLESFTDQVLCETAKRCPRTVAPLNEGGPEDTRWRSKDHYRMALQNTLTIINSLSYHSMAGNLEALITTGVRIELLEPGRFTRTHRYLWIDGRATNRTYQGTQKEVSLRHSAPGTDKLDGSRTASRATEEGVDVGVSIRDTARDELGFPLHRGLLQLGPHWNQRRGDRTGYGATASFESISVTAAPSHLYAYDLELTAELGGYWRPRGLWRGMGTLGLLGTHWFVRGEPTVTLIGGTADSSVKGKVLLSVPDQYTPPGGKPSGTGQAGFADGEPEAAGRASSNSVEPETLDPDTAKALAYGSENAAQGEQPFHGHQYQTIGLAAHKELSKAAESVMAKASSDSWHFTQAGAPANDAVARALLPHSLTAGSDVSTGATGVRLTGLFGKGSYLDRLGTMIHRVRLVKPTVISDAVKLDTEQQVSAELQASGAGIRTRTFSLTGMAAFLSLHGATVPPALGTYAITGGGGRSRGTVITTARNVTIENAQEDGNHKYLVSAAARHEMLASVDSRGLTSPLHGLLTLFRQVWQGMRVTIPQGWIGAIPERVAHRLKLVDDGVGEVPLYTEQRWSRPAWAVEASLGSFPVNTLDATLVVAAFDKKLAALGVSDTERERVRSLVTPRAMRSLRGQMSGSGAVARARAGRWQMPVWTDKTTLDIGGRTVPVRVQLLAGESTFDGLGHSVVLTDNRIATESLEATTTTTGSRSAGVLAREGVRTGDNVIRAAGAGYSETGADHRTTTTAEPQERAVTQNFKFDEPHAEYLTPYRLRLSIDIDGVPPEEGSIGILREQVPLSLTTPDPDANAAPTPAADAGAGLNARATPVAADTATRPVAEGEGTDARHAQAVPARPGDAFDPLGVPELPRPGRAVIVWEGQVQLQAVLDWRRDRSVPTGLTSDNFQVRKVVGLGNLKDASDITVATAYGLLPRPRAKLTGDELDSAVQRARRTDFTRPGTAPALALENATSDAALSGFFLEALSEDGYQVPGLADAPIVGDTRGDYRLYARPDFTRARLLTVAPAAGMDGGVKLTSGQEMTLDYSGAHDTSLNSIPLFMTSQAGSVVPGPSGTLLNSREGDSAKVGRSAAPYTNLKPTTSSAMLFAIPTDWLGIAEVHHTIRDSRMGKAAHRMLGPLGRINPGPRAAEAQTYTLAWVREDAARAWGLIDDRNFPSQVAEAWEAVKAAGDAWAAADQAYWNKRRTFGAAHSEHRALPARITTARQTGAAPGPAAGRQGEAASGSASAATTGTATDTPAGVEQRDAAAEAGSGEATAAPQSVQELQAQSVEEWEAQRAARDEEVRRLREEELAELLESAKRAAKEFHRVRYETDRMTRWHQLPAEPPEDGSAELRQGLPEPPPVAFTAPAMEDKSAGHPRFTQPEDEPNSLVSPEGQAFVVHDVPKDGQGFFHALGEALWHVAPGHPKLPAAGSPEARAAALRQLLADQLAQPDNRDLWAFAAPDTVDTFTAEELSASGILLPEGSTAAKEFKDAQRLSPYLSLPDEQRGPLAVAGLRRPGDAPGEAGWNQAAADLLPALAARTLQVQVTVVGDDGSFVTFSPSRPDTADHERSSGGPAPSPSDPGDAPSVVLRLAEQHYQVALPEGTAPHYWPAGTVAGSDTEPTADADPGPVLTRPAHAKAPWDKERGSDAWRTSGDGRTVTGPDGTLYDLCSPGGAGNGFWHALELAVPSQNLRAPHDFLTRRSPLPGTVPDGLPLLAPQESAQFTTAREGEDGMARLRTAEGQLADSETTALIRAQLAAGRGWNETLTRSALAVAAEEYRAEITLVYEDGTCRTHRPAGETPRRVTLYQRGNEYLLAEPLVGATATSEPADRTPGTEPDQGEPRLHRHPQERSGQARGGSAQRTLTEDNLTERDLTPEVTELLTASEALAVRVAERDVAGLACRPELQATWQLTSDVALGDVGLSPLDTARLVMRRPDLFGRAAAALNGSGGSGSPATRPDADADAEKGVVAGVDVPSNALLSPARGTPAVIQEAPEPEAAAVFPDPSTVPLDDPAPAGLKHVPGLDAETLRAEAPRAEAPPTGTSRTGTWQARTSRSEAFPPPTQAPLRQEHGRPFSAHPGRFVPGPESPDASQTTQDQAGTVSDETPFDETASASGDAVDPGTALAGARSSVGRGTPLSGREAFGTAQVVERGAVPDGPVTQANVQQAAEQQSPSSPPQASATTAAAGDVVAVANQSTTGQAPVSLGDLAMAEMMGVRPEPHIVGPGAQQPVTGSGADR